jgi:hypothetical protein
MFKRINNWQLSGLVAIVSIASIAMIQQYVDAQGWQDPGALPGGTPASNLVVNPMVEDLQLGGNDVAGTGIRVSDTGTTAIEVNDRDINITGTGRLCFDGSDCESSWPTVTAGGGKWNDGTEENEIVYNPSGILPKIGIGVSNPAYPIHVKDYEGELKIQSDRIWSLDAGIFVLANGGTIEISADDNGNPNPKASYFMPSGRLGIATDAPGYPLHISDDDSMAVLNIDNEGDHLWTGTRLERDNIEKWFVGMNDADDKLRFRANNAIDSIDSMILDSDNVDTALNLQGDDTSFFTVSVIDSWDDNVSNAGINFSRNAWKTDVYTDYTMAIKYGSFYLDSYYTTNSGTAFSATPLFVKDIGTGEGLAETAGYVGINTTNPLAQLHVDGDIMAVDGGITAFGNADGESDIKLQNDSGRMKIIFQEYDSAPGDFFLNYNGDNSGINSGYSNWLEFWGRDFDTNDPTAAIPILSMQRDYQNLSSPDVPVYQGVGIGVPSETIIDTKLRVRSGSLGEDILQLYDEDTEVFTVADGGHTTVNGDLRVANGAEGDNNYMQVDVTSVYPPSGSIADCDEPSEYGRIVWHLPLNKFFICDDDGWKYEAF